MLRNKNKPFISDDLKTQSHRMDIGIIGMTISTFPEQPKQYDKDVEELFSIDKTEEDKQIDSILDELMKYEKERDLEKYEKKKKKSLLILLKGFGVLVFMWGLLYTGFWIGSGFSSDKKKDETNE